MAKIHVSPGAYFKTIDLSAYIPKLTKSSYGVVGKFKKGPIEPTIIGDPQTFIDVFGAPEKGMHSALSALLYLENGDQLYVKRLVGRNAVRAKADIPAGKVIAGEKILATNGYDYQFHMSLNHTPIPGTLMLKIGNNSFYDNRNGKIIGSSTSLYCNYIDYDSGLYRFTLKTAPAINENVEIRYNGKLFIITNENVGVMQSGSSTFTGLLKRTGLFFQNAEAKVVVKIGTRVLTGNTFNSQGDLILAPETGSTLSDSGTINPVTSEIVLSLDNSVAITEDTPIIVDYNTYSEQTTLIGIGDGETRSFSGFIKSRVSPGTSSIWVNNVLISEDQKNGDYVGNNLVYSDNSIDYTTNNIKLALTYEPAKDTEIYATYSTKAECVVHLFDEDSLTKTFTGKIDVAPIIKGSVEILIDSLYLKDDNEGNLIGTAGNGSINYATGEVIVNLKDLPLLGTVARAKYLAKYGEMVALYHGEYGNGLKGRFSVKDHTGYNLELWLQNQIPGKDSPDEFWSNINLGDVNSELYITNKVSSYHIYVDPIIHDNTYLEPLLGELFMTSGGKADLDDITEDDAILGIKVFENPENFDINILACPDYAGNKKVALAMIQVCESRGECICIIDPPAKLTPRQVCDWSNGESSWNLTPKFDSSFAAMYYPWMRVNNPALNYTELVPPSVVIPAMYTYTDNVAASWYAPAGVNRGKLTKAIALERKLSLEDRNLIYGYPNIINPIISIPGQGIVVWGQKTAQRKPTALDRVSVRRLMNYISKVMSTAFMELLFEPNDHISWTKYKHIVIPILEEIQANRGLYSCNVICDSSTNPPSVVERNEMHAKIYLQPMKTVEIIETTFILTGLGATVTN